VDEFHRSCDIQGRGSGGDMFGVYFIHYNDRYVFIIRSNMGLYVPVKVSLICDRCFIKIIY
jgi:hypothetical protein